ncbi:MAG: phage tail protein [Ruminococcus sp.]|nr:phage tail protein [Ruminococcus sp.]
MYEITIKNGSAASVLHDGKNIFASAGNFTEEVNCIPSANIDILRNNPCWDLLHDRKTVVEIRNVIADEVEFEGTLLRSTDKMTNSGQVIKSLICEGFLGYLCDSIQPYHHYENTTAEAFVEALLSVHNSMMPEEKRIYLGSCDIVGDTANSKTTAYRNTLEEIKVNLLDRIGGEIRIRKVDGRLVLDLLTQYGTQTNTTIELAKNIRSLEVSSDPANIITRLIPLGAQLDASSSAERLTIAEVNDGKIYIDDENAIAKYGIIAGTAVFDNITIPANLKTAGQDYLINNNRVKKSYSANVIELSVLDSSEQSIRAGNSYRFRNSFIGLDEDLRLMKRKVNIFEPYAPEVEIGDKAEKMTDIAVRTAQLIEYRAVHYLLYCLASRTGYPCFLAYSIPYEPA